MNAKRLSHSNPAKPNILTKQEEAVSALILLYVSVFSPSIQMKLMSHIVNPPDLNNGAIVDDVDKEQLAALIDIAAGDYLDIVEENGFGENSTLFSDNDLSLLQNISSLSGEDFVKTAGEAFFQCFLAMAAKIYQM